MQLFHLPANQPHSIKEIPCLDNAGFRPFSLGALWSNHFSFGIAVNDLFLKIVA